MEKAILDVYKENTNSPYDKIQKSPYWGIMHDGIAKFSKEFNGVYMRGINDDFEPFNVPYCLSRMEGGVNGFDLGKWIFTCRF